MIKPLEYISDLDQKTQEHFKKSKTILSFQEFLNQVKSSPKSLIRNSASFIKDTLDYFGKEEVTIHNDTKIRFKLFDKGTEKHKPIIANEGVQESIYKNLGSFVQQGFPNKLIMLHGPNGTAKTSIIESITYAMHRYSKTEEGAVYRFNWIFPTDKTATPKAYGETGPIGFAGLNDQQEIIEDQSYAYLEEGKVACKIHSEYKENPIYLIPMPQREIWLKQWIAESEGKDPDDIQLPPHIYLSGLSKRNQLIYEQLLSAYNGQLSKVFRHIQVERFFYSRQYRIGVGTIEPQMSIDAIEKQMTMDKNLANLPTILQNISFHEAAGPLIEANRGLLEFSDLLKRPLETFKYLLSTIENSTLNLASSTANLDIVFVATSNEKHLDAFKAIPDFASFKSRFELVTVPYLLKPSDEEKIYSRDIKLLSKRKKVSPHTVNLLCSWAALTRYKQPDPDYYETKYRTLVSKIDPVSKMKLYDSQPLTPAFNHDEEKTLKEIAKQVYEESDNVSIYEGRYGASPREITAILHLAAQNPKHETLTPMAIFDELEKLVKDKTVYEFLQIEPRGKYHQPSEFIELMKDEFTKRFEREIITSMTLVEEQEYDSLLNKYIDNVVAQVKKEKVLNKITGSYDDPSEKLMKDVETIIGTTGSISAHREALLGRIAAYKLDNPNKKLVLSDIFENYLKKIQDHYHAEQQSIVEDNYKAILTLDEENHNLSDKQIELAETTIKNLSTRFSYDEISAKSALKFMISHRKKKS